MIFKKLKYLIASLCGISSLSAHCGQTVQVNSEVSLWYETFGQKENPACLLIMGAGGTGMFWSAEFCEQLAQKGLYVIRYDQRDAGLSTAFDFANKPYTLLDMANDALDLLKSLHIEKAHVVGFSMGGPIAELISIRDPHRIKSLTLGRVVS